MDLASLFPAATLAAVQSTFAGFAALGSVFVDAWQAGDPGEQLYQAITQTIQAYTGNNAQAIRGQYLDTATDPGDYDPFNALNETLTPAPGALSALGLSMFFTERPGETYATTTITLTNGGSLSAGPFAPGQLIVAKFGYPDITYRNAADPAVYIGAGGTYTLLAGQSVDLEFTAESPGSASNADPGELTALVTSYSGVTVTNASAAIGTDRMSADNYRALCRTQAAATSPNGAADAFLRSATTNLDGTPLLQSLTTTPAGDGVTAVGITKVYVSPGSTTGIVNVYFADDDGASIAVDVAAANENITLNVISVPGTITYTGLPAIETTITVTWTVKYLAKYQGRAVTAASVSAAIVAALGARMVTYPIGGFDQVLGAGTIYASDLRGTVDRAHPAIYSTVLSAPAGDTAILLGHVAVIDANAGGSTETAG